MPIVKNQIFIRAPIDLCFDLARNVDIHSKTVSKTKERAIGGVTTGLLEIGDIVVWEAVHFGIKQRLTSKVTAMNKPCEFVDIMLKGAFHSFTHTHQFINEKTGTIMIDIFKYKTPLGPMGTLIDKLFLEKYMINFISSRARELKKIAEETHNDFNT